MLPSSRTRYATGLTLGALAGASLCASVLPLGLQWAGYGSHLAVSFYLSRLIWFAALVMAIGGVGVARSRHALEAVKVFSLAGLTAGAGLAALGLEAAPRLLALAGLTGWMYGLLGGLVIGRILAAPPASVRPAAAGAAHGRFARPGAGVHGNRSGRNGRRRRARRRR